MKTYEQTIEMLADHAFDSYMNGSYSPMSECDTGLVAKIYELDSVKVLKDLSARFEEVRTAYHAKFAKNLL